MATETKATDVSTSTELFTLLKRIQNDIEQSGTHGLNERHDAMVDVAEWVQELLDNHQPDGGTLDEMPF